MDDYSLKPAELRKIFLFCFNAELDDKRDKILEMPATAFKIFDAEVRKAIRRTKPKLNNIDKIMKKNKKTKIEYYEAEGEFTMFNLNRESGVWRKKY